LHPPLLASHRRGGGVARVAPARVVLLILRGRRERLPPIPVIGKPGDRPRERNIEQERYLCRRPRQPDDQ
jgi:hypothetical protein